MPISILDYVKSVAGDKPQYTADDFYRNGVELLGGCERCGATIAAYNAYPATSGFWRCADCIGDDGYETVTAFRDRKFSERNCPVCGAPGNSYEVPSVNGVMRHAFTCRECCLAWTDTH
jgi:hypothetical protein